MPPDPRLQPCAITQKPKPEKAAGGSDFKAPQSDQALISQLRAAQAEAAGLRGQLQEQEEETQQRVSAAEAAAMAAQEELWHMSAEQRTAEESAAAVDALVARARSQLVEGLLHCDSEEQQEPATPQHPPLPQSSSGGALHAWGSGAGEELVAFSERRARAAGSDQASAMGPLAAGRVASKLKVGSSSRPSTSDGSSDAGLPADRAAAPAHALVLMAAREGEGAGEDDEAQAARLAEALQQLERMRLEKEQLAAAAARREQALAAAEARLAASNATVARMQALAQALGGIKCVACLGGGTRRCKNACVDLHRSHDPHERTTASISACSCMPPAASAPHANPASPPRLQAHRGASPFCRQQDAA